MCVRECGYSSSLHSPLPLLTECLITQVAGDCLLLCRDARDGFDKLSSEARKQSLEGARRRWESSIALALSLQAPVIPVLCPSTSTSASVSSSSSAPSVNFPIDSSVAAASGSYESSYPSLLPSSSSSLEVQGAIASAPGVVSNDFPSYSIKIEGGVEGDSASRIDPTSIKEEKAEGKEERSSSNSSSSSSSSSKGSASKESSGSSSSGSSRVLSGGSEALYPAITMKLEDMPVSACRVVNPFSRSTLMSSLALCITTHTSHRVFKCILPAESFFGFSTLLTA